MSRKLFVIVLALSLIHINSALARKEEPVRVELRSDTPRKSSPGPAAAPNRQQAGVIQSWSFDNGGVADPQGWTVFDRTAQPPYWHIDNVPGSGRVLWCGSMSLSGYGNYWKQVFMSKPFNNSGGDITVSFHIKYDCEPSYDNVFFEYASNDNVWHIAETFSGVGETTVNQLISNAAYSGPIRFRFRFNSDDAWSNEDSNYPSDFGAAQISNLAITEAGNPTPLDSQNFITQPVGATTTSDGDWQAYSGNYGNYAGLVDGNGVLQQDAQAVNTTHFWSFFNGSPDNYSCGGFPSQPVVPFKKTTNAGEEYIWNEIRSPTISLAGILSSEPVLLSFDVYKDLPIDNTVLFEWWVRSRVSGVWGPWTNTNNVYYGDVDTWQTFTKDLRSRITASATDIQVAIGVRDMCEDVCGFWGSGACHSHGPLIDNVRITTSNTPTGTMVQSSPIDPTTNTNPVLLTFDNVTDAGLTTVTSLPTNGGMPYGSTTYYEVSTSAAYTGNIQIQVKYVEADLLVPEASLRLLHWDTSLTPDQWVDVTTSLNTSTNRIYGTTTSLSPFVLAQALPTDAGASPQGLALHQNVPNPFNPSTTISFEVPAGGARVELRIYDAAGSLVRTLVDEQRAGGTQRVTWDGRNGLGEPVASGVYFYRMTSGSFTESRRMVLLK